MEKVKKIWLVNQYAMPPQYESRLRTIKFAHYLAEADYDVTIFASSIMHNMNIDLIADRSSYKECIYDNLKFVHIKTRAYGTNGLLRIYSSFQFHFKLFFLRKKFKSPDCIIHTAVIPFGNILYYCAKKLKSKYIVEILDLWPESFVAFGLISKKNPITKILFKMEKWLYTKADNIVFSMEGGKDYIVQKKWDLAQGGSIDLNKVHYINNGVDLTDFNTYRSCYILDDADLLDTSCFKVIYLGSIRLANGLKSLIDAAKHLKGNSSIKFLIYGDGADRETLEKYCMENNISNVIFKQKWIGPQYVPFVLSQASVNILNYSSNYIWNYGGSQSKLFQYLASGKPICSNLKMGYCLISKYNLGIASKFESSKDYAEAILALKNMPTNEYNAMCKRAEEVALQYDYKILSKKLINIL